MKDIKPVTAAAAIILAAALPVCVNPYSEDIQFLNTPAKASLSAADSTSAEADASSAGSEETLSWKDYAGKYTMFGLGNTNTNFQNKKIVISNEGRENGSVILYDDRTGIVLTGAPGEPEEEQAITDWSVSDGTITITGESFGFSGSIEDGIMTLSERFSAETMYFALGDADLSAYSFVENDKYAVQCMTGTYYLTGGTMPDESEFPNRTQISWNVLTGLWDASLKLNEDGTGTLDVEGQLQDITWNTEGITLHDQEFSLSRDGCIFTLDLFDHILEFTFFGEDDNFLQLTWDEVEDQVKKEIPGSICPIGGTGLEYYIPASYTMLELPGDLTAAGLVSWYGESEADVNDDGYFDNDLYAYLVPVSYSSPEALLKALEAQDNTLSCNLVTINGRVMVCCESFSEEANTHSFDFYILHDNGYMTDIQYRTQHSIMSDSYRALVYKLASSIRKNA